MQERKYIKDDVPWETKLGYSRAVKVGNLIEVSGTVANDKGTVIGVDNPFKQTKFILEKIEETLKQLGSSKNDIIRTRIFVMDITDNEGISKAHREFFKGIEPATSMVEVSRFISLDYLVEIEVSAITNEG